MDNQEKDFLEDTEIEDDIKKKVKRAKIATSGKHTNKRFRQKERNETNNRESKQIKRT